MKPLKILSAFLILVLIASSPIMAQKRSSKSKIIPIKNFTFTKKAFMNYKRQKVKPAVLVVNSRGKGYPAKGYKMAITSDDKYILIVPQGATFSANTGIDAHPANGGVYWCYCPGYPDDCTWETYGNPNDGSGELDLVCEGSCECGVAFEADEIGGILDREPVEGY
jgi:hypothetical protein